MTFFIFTIGPLLLSNLVVADFGYDDANGPANWGKKYGTCMGKYQSPIDIEEKDVTIANFPPLQFSGVDRPYEAYMTNNGHTVMIGTQETDVPTISGGPLNDTYLFQQLHFHWGQTDNVGSEDLINNRSFSMELHAVFYKKSHRSYAEAINHSDGLTVLGYLYQATDEPNPVFDPIVSQIPEIVALGSNDTINNPSILSKLIAPDIASLQSYYSYKGSLTTPPCSEIVQWIDFIKPETISHEQLAAFRVIQASDGTNLTHNFRPVQPLDGRVIYRNSAEGPADTSGATNTSPTSAIPTTSTVSTTSEATKPSTASTTTTTTSAETKPTKTTATTTVSSTTPTERVALKDPGTHHSGQDGLGIISPIAILFGLIFFLPYQ